MNQGLTGGLLGGPTPKRAHLATIRALCYKIPQPSKPYPVREAGKRGGSRRKYIGQSLLAQEMMGLHPQPAPRLTPIPWDSFLGDRLFPFLPVK